MVLLYRHSSERYRENVVGLHSLNYDVGDFDRNEHSENVYVDSPLSSFCSGGLIINARGSNVGTLCQSHQHIL